MNSAFNLLGAAITLGIAAGVVSGSPAVGFLVVSGVGYSLIYLRDVKP